MQKGVTKMIHHFPLRRRVRTLVACLIILSAASGASAQQNSAQVKPTAQPVQSISTEQAIYLVRSALLTLNDANRSGNYTVLRDLAAPDFQAKNTATDLGQIFTDLRRRRFDLFAVGIIAPQFTTAPALDASGKARLTGFFPTRPLQISFDLTFQSVAGQWRLFAISVATPEAPAAHSQLQPLAPVSRAKRGVLRNTWARVSANPAALTIAGRF
jgi:hypothetical protein